MSIRGSCARKAVFYHTSSKSKMAREMLCFILGADAAGRGAVLMLELCWTQVGPCWVNVGATWSSRDHVGSCSIKIGARLAHVGAGLGL